MSVQWKSTTVHNGVLTLLDFMYVAALMAIDLVLMVKHAMV